MKIIAIGDIHGREDWKAVFKTTRADQYVFIGDYFDTHGTETAHQQMENFKRIIETKKELPNKVTLLLGNHDFHYLKEAGDDRYSGFQDHHQEMIRDLLERAIVEDQIQVAYEADGVLYTHAGVTKTWLKDHATQGTALPINILFKNRPEAFRFAKEGHSLHGDDPCQGPLWVRPDSLLGDKGVGKQVVGHTQQEHVLIKDGVAFIDTLGTSKEYLVVEDGNFSVALLTNQQ